MEYTEDILPFGAPELRDHFVGARVTRTQYERINAIAKNCDMSVSEYILARCYGYEPKARLTPVEMEATQALICYRKDLLAYTNALKAMASNARFALFDNVEFMRGWSLDKGHLKYKASELGKGRNLMATKIESTWRKLHEAPTNEQRQAPMQPKDPTPAAQSKPNVVPPLISLSDYREYEVYRSGYIPYQLTENGIGYRFFIPVNIYRLFDDEFDYREYDNSTELIDKAVALFVGFVVPPDDVYVPSGGGSINNEVWGRDPKDDDKSWTKRCIQAASRIVKPRKKTRGRGR